MNFMMLTNTMDYSQPIGDVTEKITFGGMMVLIGMTAVFIVLAIIWLALKIFKAAFQNVSDNKGNKAVTNEPAAELAVVSADHDEEIVAVIAAAIAMAESESNGIKFKVVSFRRV